MNFIFYFPHSSYSSIDTYIYWCTYVHFCKRQVTWHIFTHLSLYWSVSMCTTLTHLWTLFTHKFYIRCPHHRIYRNSFQKKKKNEGCNMSHKGFIDSYIPTTFECHVVNFDLCRIYLIICRTIEWSWGQNNLSWHVIVQLLHFVYNRKNKKNLKLVLMWIKAHTYTK